MANGEWLKVAASALASASLVASAMVGYGDLRFVKKEDVVEIKVVLEGVRRDQSAIKESQDRIERAVERLRERPPR